MELRLEGDGLAVVDGDLVRRPTAGRDAREQLPDDRGSRAAAKIPERLLDRDPLGSLRRDPSDAPKCVVGSVAGRADDRGDGGGTPGSTRGDALGDIEDRSDPRLVVGEVDDDHALADPEQVEAARGSLGRWAEVDDAVAYLLDRRPETARPTGRGERIRHVVASEPADRDRDAGDLGDPRLVGAASWTATDLEEPAVANDVGTSPGCDVPPAERRPDA